MGIKTSLLVCAAVWASGCSCGTVSSTSDASVDRAVSDRVSRDTLSESPFLACETISLGAMSAPSSLVFVIDNSGSMNCPATGSCDQSDPSMISPTADPNDSRWDVFRQELRDALRSLRGDQEIGVYRYPDPVSYAQLGTEPSDGHPLCISRTPVLPLTQVSGLSDFDNLFAYDPVGGTPTHDAMVVGFEMANRTRNPGATFVVLATDGQASRCRGCLSAGTNSECDQAADNEALIQRVAAANAAGVRTFVIGVVGSDAFRDELSELAIAGGTAPPGCNPASGGVCHFDLTRATNLGTELAEALGQIRQVITSCSFAIPPNPDGVFDPTLVNLVMTSDDGTIGAVPRDLSSANGWNYSADMTEVVLFGAYCEQAISLSTGSITVSFGCPTLIL